MTCVHTPLPGQYRNACRENVCGERGLMPLLAELLPAELKHAVAMISIQELLGEIAPRPGNEWTHDFAGKYGLAEGHDNAQRLN